MSSITNNLITTTVEHQILTVWINNPPHNYLQERFFSVLDECYLKMTGKDIHAVIITGTSKVFSKGADSREFVEGKNLLSADRVIHANEVFSKIECLEKPVIAAISGACLGGGFELALSCHFRLCAEKSRLGLPEVSMGVIPGLGGIQRLSRLIGQAKTLEMVLLGDIISAEKAFTLNIINRIYPRDEFMKHVNIFVRTLLSARKEAIQSVLSLFRQQLSSKENELIMNSARYFLCLANSLYNR